MTRLVLASQSPARAKLLTDAGLRFEVRASPLDEDAAKRRLSASGATPKAMARRLAGAKALASPAEPDEWIIGADQTLDLDGDLLEKPGSPEGLRLQLERLRGRGHHLHAAAVVVRGGRSLWEGCSTVRVTMRSLRDDEIGAYVVAEGPNVLGCVGGYKLEGPGVRLLEAVEGDYFSVLGLPMLELLAALRALGAGP